MTVLRQSTLRVAGVGLTWLYTLYRVHPAVWRVMARNYRPWMGRFARLHAWMTCQFAWLDVPAYRAHLQRGGWEFRWFRLGSYPPTNKQNYVAAFPEEQRCRRGELEIEGSVVDESSGSSGRPFNWVRSRRELRSVHKNLAGFTTMVFPGRRRFVINAYSMGAWATGTNTGIAMARIAMVKNTGPDLAKIADTLRHFGPGFDYVVTAYPPFLKHLRDRLDAEGFPSPEYRISGLVGGEAMTEALRDYLEERFRKVRSSYRAGQCSALQGEGRAGRAAKPRACLNRAGSAARCTDARSTAEPRRPTRRSTSRTTACWPASSAGPVPGTPGGAGGRTDALERVDQLGQGDLRREVHQQVDVVVLAVELDQLALEVRAHGPHDLLHARQVPSLNTLCRYFVTKTKWACRTKTQCLPVRMASISAINQR